MALIQFDFYSQVIGVETSMNVILPQRKSEEDEEDYLFRDEKDKFPVLYLLHGLSDDHTAWVRKTSIERYVNEMGLAVVMPAVHRSFYTDMVYGYDYWSFISEELMEIACRYFPLSSARKDNFAAGLSMGGYGAFKMALRCPEKFAAAASLSGALDIVRVAEEEDDVGRELSLIFGNVESIKGSSNDLMALLKEAADNNINLPDLYHCCGTDDFLYHDNLRFINRAQELDIDIKFEEDPGIGHEWSYWDRKIQRFLNIISLTK